MPLYPKKETIISFESGRRTVTVDKTAYGPGGFSHYEVHVPTDIADRYPWENLEGELSLPLTIDYYDGNEVVVDTGAMGFRNVGVDGDRLPGDTSDGDSRVMAPDDAEAVAQTLYDLVESAEREVGAFWTLEV